MIGICPCSAKEVRFVSMNIICPSIRSLVTFRFAIIKFKRAWSVRDFVRLRANPFTIFHPFSPPPSLSLSSQRRILRSRRRRSRLQRRSQIQPPILVRRTGKLLFALLQTVEIQIQMRRQSGQAHLLRQTRCRRQHVPSFLRLRQSLHESTHEW